MFCLIQFLEQYLKYLDDWKERVEAKKSEGMTAAQRAKLFFSLPTHKGNGNSNWGFTAHQHKGSVIWCQLGEIFVLR